MGWAASQVPVCVYLYVCLWKVTDHAWVSRVQEHKAAVKAAARERRKEKMKKKDKQRRVRQGKKGKRS